MSSVHEEFERLLAQARSLADPARKALVESLPALNEADLVALHQQDSSCPICPTPFPALLAAEEMALAMDSPANASQDLGVTKLVNSCGHLFCRKDISTWIREAHDSCPTCRRPLITASAESTLSQAEEPITMPLNQPELSITGSSFDTLLDMLRQGRPTPSGDRDAGSPSGHDEYAAAGPAQDNDRHEYSGMYS